MAGERILVVSGDPDLRTGLSAMLKEAEYDVLTAASGDEGMILARDLGPDLLVADYGTPIVSGLELAESIRRDGLGIPVILVAGDQPAETVIRALRAGVRDYLTRPLDPDQFLNSVRRVLNDQLTRWIMESVPDQLLQANRLLERHLRELDTLIEIGKSITSQLDLEIVLERVVEAAVQLTGAEESSLLLIEPESGELVVRAAKNFDRQTVETLRLRVEDSLAGQVVQTGHLLRYSGDESRRIQSSYLVKSLVYVPLAIQDNVIGVLGVDNRTDPRPFTDHEVNLLRALADYAAIAIENARLYSQTEHERSTLDAILHDTEDAIIVVDSDDRVLFCNPTAQRAFGVSGDFEGKPLADVVHHEDVLELFSKKALTGRGRQGEVRLEDGRVLHGQLTIIEGVGRAAVMQDITHLKELDKIKSEFVTMVSHDLRSPLTAILGYVELLSRSGPLNEQQRKFVDRIVFSVRQITALIADLLELGKIEAGFDADREPVQVPMVVQYAVDGLRHRADEKGHRLEVDIPERLPEVLGNPVRLRRMVANLLDNAIKYTPDGGLIGVSVWEDGGLLFIQVSDNGIGIPVEDQPHIFDKFFRSRTAAALTEEGTGLGLSIVKSIVEQHGGRIWFESSEGRGTTFTVVLPIYTPSDQREVRARAARPYSD